MNRASFERLDHQFQLLIEMAHADREAALADFEQAHPDLIETLRGMLSAHDAADDRVQSTVQAASQWFDDAHPERFGPWRVTGHLGQGGMGQVYLAERDDGEYQRQVAIKTIKLDQPQLLKRFTEERQVLATLVHPHIATLLDGGQWSSGEQDSAPYLVMEYVEGQDILSHAESRRLSTEARLELFLALCSAVQFAHQHLIVHRDIKPANVLIDPAGQVKLLDFGIAKWIDESEGHAQTGSMTSIMTPQFASPEQLNGGLLTTATDVYGLGVLLYHLLCGGGPHDLDGLSIGEIATLLRDTPPRPPSALTDGLDPALDAVLMACCHPDPASRYATVGQLAEDIRRVMQHEPIQMKPPSRWQRFRLFSKRHVALVWTTAAFALALVTLLGLHLYRVEVEQSKVRAEADRAGRVSQFMIDLFDRANPAVAQGEAIDPKALLDQGMLQIESDLNDEPVLQTQLYRTIGRAYLKLGQYEAARTAVERALSIAPREDDEDVDTLANLHLLMGDVTYNLGDMAASRHHSEVAIATAQERFGEQHQAVATALTNLGVLACNASDFETCTAHYEKALAIRTQLHGPEHDRVGTAHNYLAMALDHQGQFDQAIEHYRQSLAILKLSLDDLHPKVFEGQANLAGALVQAGQTDEAKALLAVAYESATQVHSASSPELAGILLQRILLHNQLEEFDISLPLAEQLVSIERAARGDAHPYVAYDLNLLGRTMLGLDRLDESEAAYRESIDILTAASNKPDYILMTAQQGLGRVFNTRQQYAEAQALLTDTWTTRQTLDGPDSWVTIWTRYDLGLAEQGLGNISEAKAHFEAVLAHAEVAFPADDPRTRLTREALATLNE